MKKNKSYEEVLEKMVWYVIHDAAEETGYLQDVENVEMVRGLCGPRAAKKFAKADPGSLQEASNFLGLTIEG